MSAFPVPRGRIVPRDWSKTAPRVRSGPLQSLWRVEGMLRQRRKSSLPPLEINSFDPFQVFEVAREPCHVLKVSHLKGHKITKGWTGDIMDTPDPYLVLQIKTTPHGKRKTDYINNNVNPCWEDTFEFFLDPKENNILEITLMDANYIYDETIGTKKYSLNDLKLNEETDVTLDFPGNSQISMKLHLSVNENPDLRHSLALCNEEKQFLQKRRKVVTEALQKLLGQRGPKSEREAPVIGLLGSGGGFRAMVCLSGVFRALSDTGLLDCITYVAGLSGSAWYISTLYSHPDFPQKSPGELQSELQQQINHSPLSLITPVGVYRYMNAIINKRLSGQPISFTDFFGHMLGDTLLPGRKDCKLSDQKEKVKDGMVPLPFYTCLHVKKNVTAKVFQEWIEFSPFEVGIAKYGTFMNSEIFGSKLFLGCLVKQYPEFPLHFLQGVWGSAFCILFKQLVRENGRKDLAQMMRESESDNNEAELDQQLANFTVEDEQERSESSTEDEDEGDEVDRQVTKLDNIEINQNFNSNQHKKVLEQTENHNQQKGEANKTEKPKAEIRREKHTSMWEGMVNGFFTNSWLDTCAGRAGMIHNPLRGLSLNLLYPISPFSPTTPNDEDMFKGSYEPLETNAKKLYLVDSGLTFNSPYPLLLRPQRGVDLYLSFDFSARPTDQTPPFKELLLAEKWAQRNDVLFPPIEELARQYAKEPVREVYLFRHPQQLAKCPMILHFVIINNRFKEYKSPGVKRETKEEKSFADFDIFDDPENPYSLYNFNYSLLQFQRMSQLMEFNTKDCLDVIKDTIATAVEQKKESVKQPPISLADVAKLKIRIRRPSAFKRLKAYVRSFSRDTLIKKMEEGPKEETDSSAESVYETDEAESPKK